MLGRCPPWYSAAWANEPLPRGSHEALQAHVEIPSVSCDALHHLGPSTPSRPSRSMVLRPRRTTVRGVGVGLSPPASGLPWGVPCCTASHPESAAHRTPESWCLPGRPAFVLSRGSFGLGTHRGFGRSATCSTPQRACGVSLFPLLKLPRSGRSARGIALSLLTVTSWLCLGCAPRPPSGPARGVPSWLPTGSSP